MSSEAVKILQAIYHLIILLGSKHNRTTYSTKTSKSQFIFLFLDEVLSIIFKLLSKQNVLLRNFEVFRQQALNRFKARHRFFPRPLIDILLIIKYIDLVKKASKSNKFLTILDIKLSLPNRVQEFVSSNQVTFI